MGNKALPKHLQGKLHKDYWWPFCYIPRAWTSYKLRQPPKLIKGKKVFDWSLYQYKDKKRAGPDPCQKTRKAWALTWPLHFTITFKKYYLRLGFRWDTVDEYYTFPAFFFGRIDGGVIDYESKRMVYRGVSRWAEIQHYD